MDYDTDGICATTMMVQLLKEIGIDVGFYIPNRLQEGYGLNVQRTMQAIVCFAQTVPKKGQDISQNSLLFPDSVGIL